jgi:hypothetical protein
LAGSRVGSEGRNISSIFLNIYRFLTVYK